MEKLNLVEILKKCPKGTKLYSVVYGEVEFVEIIKGDAYPIRFIFKDVYDDASEGTATKEGLHLAERNGECTLFPSKDQRDWNKFKIKKERFDPETLKTFDKVLVRDDTDETWYPEFFGYKKHNSMRVICVGGMWDTCIPFNKETEHLVGTTEEAPEFYRYWEED